MLWSKIFNIYCIFTFLVYGQNPRWSLIQVVSTLDITFIDEILLLLFPIHSLPFSSAIYT